MLNCNKKVGLTISRMALPPYRLYKWRFRRRALADPLSPLFSL